MISGRGFEVAMPTPWYSYSRDGTLVILPEADLITLSHGLLFNIVLLEPLRQALAAGHELLDAALDAAVLTLRDGLGGEVVDARGEAVVDKIAVELFIW